MISYILAGLFGFTFQLILAIVSYRAGMIESPLTTVLCGLSGAIVGVFGAEINRIFGRKLKRTRKGK